MVRVLISCEIKSHQRTHRWETPKILPPKDVSTNKGQGPGILRLGKLLGGQRAGSQEMSLSKGNGAVWSEDLQYCFTSGSFCFAFDGKILALSFSQVQKRKTNVKR